MHKFQRNYRCEFSIGEQDISGNRKEKEKLVISYPITLSLNVSRSAHSDCNTGNFKFYNLNKDYQQKLWRDFYQASKYVKMSLYAGYGDNMPLIFDGLFQKCSTYRQSGGTEMITEIQATDASYLYQYGFSNITASKGTEAEDVFSSLLQDVPDIKIGFISPEIEPLKRDTTYLGQPMDIITSDYSKYQIFVDNGNLHVLGERDVIPTEKYVITANSGLLGSPQRAEQTIELDMIFEPGLRIGQSAVLLSDTIENLNGTYKVLSIDHNGVISPVMSDKLTTHVALLTGGQFNELTKKSGFTEVSVDGAGWLRPVSDVITSDYGWRTHPIFKTKKFHTGIDYGCGMRTKIKATQNGKVSFAGVINGFGKTVKINHGKVNGNNVESQYSHLDSFSVVQNEIINKGDVIALSGSTGYSTGPHLHFEIHENGNNVDPKKYIGAK